MLYLDSQKQFAQQMDLAAQGKNISFDPVYADRLRRSQEENQNALWTSEEATERISEDLALEVEQKLLDLVEQSPETEEKKEQLKNLARRGQLLLVSSDEGPERSGGPKFDHFLTLKEAREASPLHTTILSPTLVSSSMKLSEVIEGQTLLHSVKVLKESFSVQNQSEKQLWRVENATIEKGVVHIEVARNGTALEDDSSRFSVEVEVDQDPALPLVYEQINKGGRERSERIPETQLPEKYGEAKPEFTEMQKISSVEGEDPSKAQAAKEAAVAIGALGILDTLSQLEALSQEEQAKEAAALTHAKASAPQGVQASATVTQAAAAAHFARQNEERKKAQERELERYKQFAILQAAEQFQKKKTQKAEQAKKDRWTADQKSIAKGAGLAAGITGAAFAGLAGSSAFVTHLTLFS
jgi:hypothetical protein